MRTAQISDQTELKQNQKENMKYSNFFCYFKTLNTWVICNEKLYTKNIYTYKRLIC